MTLEEFKKECEIANENRLIELKSFDTLSKDQERYGKNYYPVPNNDISYCPNCDCQLNCKMIDYTKGVAKYIYTCEYCSYTFAQERVLTTTY